MEYETQLQIDYGYQQTHSTVSLAVSGSNNPALSQLYAGVRGHQSRPGRLATDAGDVWVYPPN
ncbi:hypothetical protein GCM10025776_02200 [Corallincola platygyrae]